MQIWSFLSLQANTQDKENQDYGRLLNQIFLVFAVVFLATMLCAYGTQKLQQQASKNVKTRAFD